MAISARCRASYQLSRLKWAPQKSCLMIWLVRAIGLVVVRGGGHVTNAEFETKQLSQFTDEPMVTIRDNAPLEAMNAKTVTEHHVRGIFSTLNLAGGDEMNHTRCSVCNCKNDIESIAILRHLGKTEDPVHCHFRVGSGRCLSKPCSPQRSGLTCWHVGQTRTNSATSCFMLVKEYWRATKLKVFRGLQCQRRIPVWH